MTFWAPTPNDIYHALDDPDARLRRSLCGLHVEVADSMVFTDTELNAIRVGRRCRSCLEKLGGRR